MNNINDIIDIFMAKAKDEVYKKAMENIKASCQRLMEIETQCRRKKASASIKAMAEMDIAIKKFEDSYQKLNNVFNEESKEKINEFINQYKLKRKKLLLEKIKYEQEQNILHLSTP